MTRRDLMGGWLRRLEDSKYRDDFVLRGGLLMDAWLPGCRSVNDLDLLGLGSLEEADQAINELCTVSGGDLFEIIRVEKTWQETPAPGLRYQLGPQPFQLDIGTGDPLVVAPHRMQVAGASVLCVAPEIMYGWKMHGLFERGEGRWKARDLCDLYLLQERMTLDPRILNLAVDMAFRSRDTELAVTERFFDDSWGRSPGSQKKWLKFRNDPSLAAGIPQDLIAVKEVVAGKLSMILRSLKNHD